MHLAVLADVHANLPALEAVLADVDRVAPAGIWVAGDLVGYNPWPNEVLQILRDRRMKAIRGNHERGAGTEGGRAVGDPGPHAPADGPLFPVRAPGEPGFRGPAEGLGPAGRLGAPRPDPPHLRDPPRSLRHRRGRHRDQAERPSNGTRGSPLHRRVMCGDMPRFRIVSFSASRPNEVGTG